MLVWGPEGLLMDLQKAKKPQKLQNEPRNGQH
jgi:hypothetical protein